MNFLGSFYKKHLTKYGTRVYNKIIIYVNYNRPLYNYPVAITLLKGESAINGALYIALFKKERWLFSKKNFQIFVYADAFMVSA